MTYSDVLLKKDSNGIKCRLDSYDIERLEDFAERTGMPTAVLLRELVVSGLDRAGIQYRVPASHVKALEFERRRIALAVEDRIREMAGQVQHKKAPAEIDKRVQQALFRRT